MGEMFALRFRYQMCWRPASPTRVPWSGPSAAWPVSWGNPFSAVGNELKVPSEIAASTHTDDYTFIYSHVKGPDIIYQPPAFPGLRCAALPPPAPHQSQHQQADMQWQPYHFILARSTTKSPQQQAQAQQRQRGPGGNWARDCSDMGSSWSWSWFVVVVVVVVVWSCGRGVVIRRSKNAPKRHYQLQLWLITKAKAQGRTSNPSPCPIPLDTPALPVNMFMIRSGSKSSSTPVNNSPLLEHGWDDSY